jgi:hypothetical protein
VTGRKNIECRNHKDTIGTKCHEDFDISLCEIFNLELLESSWMVPCELQKASA